jgi:hypothetical protein
MMKEIGIETEIRKGIKVKEIEIAIVREAVIYE